ncbi:MAG TPA: PxKF domain-containing protein [Gaiellaceae bacterium]|jgi:hypothetical protein
MKTFLLMCAAAFAAACFVPSSALAYTSTGTSYPLIVVDNSAGDQSEPHVGGRYSSYNVLDSAGANSIGYYDFATQTRGAIAQTPSDNLDNLSDVSGNTIVFMRISISGGSSAIDSYPVGGTATEVAPVPPPGNAQRNNPSIGASTIAWEDVGVAADMNPEIVVDLGGVLTRLTNDPAADQNPNVSPDGSAVVWERCSANCDVYSAVKSGSGWSVSPVAATSANETSPDTNGSVVVYASDASGSSRVHVASLSGGGDQTIPLPPGTSDANHPAVAGDFVVFEAGTNLSHDIWVYDLADGSFRQITNTPQDYELLADISASTTSGVTTVNVVWEVFGGATGFDVYGSQFQVTSQPPFTDQFLSPLAQSTDPANPVINTGKNGRVIPVKVQISQGGIAVTDANAAGPVTIAVSKLASCSSSAGSDPVTSYADAGQSSAGTNQFHYDAGAQAWVYNLDTKALGLVTGNCYRIDVSVNGTQIANAFAVFQPTK